MSEDPKHEPGEEERVQLSRPVLVAGSTLFFFMGIGTFMYHWLESWSWIDSFYFSVVALTTTGFRDVAPTKELTRLFTAFFLLTGAGIVVAALGVIGSRYFERRQQWRERRIRQRENDPEAWH